MLGLVLGYMGRRPTFQHSKDAVTHIAEGELPIVHRLIWYRWYAVVVIERGHIIGDRSGKMKVSETRCVRGMPRQRWGYTKSIIRYHPHLFSLMDGE